MKIISYFNGNLFRVFVLISLVICLFYVLVFEPITWQAKGDAVTYINMAKDFLGINEQSFDQSHRQPLYALFIVPFIWLFGEQSFIYPLMISHYILVFASSLLVYKLFEKLKLWKPLPFLTGLAYLFNISTIFYGYNMLSETLALFIFVWLTYLLVLYSKSQSYWILILLGIANGLMVLVRYNAMGIPLVVFIAIGIIHFHHNGFRKLILFFKRAIVYSASVFLILNFWMLYNLENKGFYGLIQMDNPRFELAVYSRINDEINISDENQAVYNIFLKNKRKLTHNKENNEVKFKKGSLLKRPFFNKIFYFFNPQKKETNYIGGWALYKEAQDELYNHFEIDINDLDKMTKLANAMESFNQELREKTKEIGTYQRISSLLQTFRSSGGTLPVNEPLNLNALPSWIFMFYKIGFAGLMLFTVVYSIIWSIMRVWYLRSENRYMLFVLILLILYFPASHFYAISTSDSNRFKFPVEPIVIGLFIYYLRLIYCHFLSLKK